MSRALSRISSVAEFNNTKQNINQPRKSSQLEQHLSCEDLYAQNRRKTNDKKDRLSKQRKSTKISQFYINRQQEEEEENDDDNYLTEQEKLWNAIEMKQDIDTITTLLENNGVDSTAKNVFNEDWTALHYAVNGGYFEVVQLLIEQYKVDIDAKTSFNKTPFHFGCRKGDSQLMKYLIDNGAITNMIDRNGNTPLHYLCEGENIELIKKFLPQLKGCKDTRNRFGKRPTDLVSNPEVKKMFRLLTQTNSLNSSTNRSGSRMQSHSRERMNMYQNKNIQIHKVHDDNKAMQQLFKKFAFSKQQNRRQTEVLTPESKQTRQETKSNKQNHVKMNSNQISPSNKLINKEPHNKPVKTYTSRLTLNNTKITSNSRLSQYKQPPQSCKSNVQLNIKQSTTNQTPQTQNSTPVKKITFNYPNKPKKKQPTQSKQIQKCSSQRDLQNTRLSSYNNQQINLQSSSKNTKTNDSKNDKLSSINKKIDQVLRETKDDFKQKKQLIIQLNEEFDGQKEESHKDKEINKEGIKSVKNVSRSDGFFLSSQGTGESTNHQLNQDQFEQTNDRNEQQQQEQTQEQIGPDSFIAHQLLGTGSFGEVYLVEKLDTGKYYAMKVLTKNKVIQNNLTRYAMTERNVLTIADHPFVVKLNYAFQTQEKLFLILDYCPGGDLAEYLQLENKFSEDKCRFYASEVVLAIEALHQKDIIFRDLKPDNIVLDQEGHALLTDFGLSKEGVFKEGMAQSFCGSYAYLAPEMLQKKGHGKAVDWYLLGVVIYEMLTGLPPYYANNKDQLFKNIQEQALKIPMNVSAAAKNLILKLLKRNPKERLGTMNGAEEIKNHPFFKQTDWDKLYKRKYNPPEPYLKKRFENFLNMDPTMKTNPHAYEQLRKEGQKTQNKQHQSHMPGWSFISKNKINE